MLQSKIHIKSKIHIICNPYMGRVVTPEPPPRVAFRRGPYRKRTLRRWHRAHPSYTVGNGTILILDQGRTCVCHPDDYEKLRQALERAA